MEKRLGFSKYCVLLIMLFTSIVAGTAQELCEELSREIFEDTDANCTDASNENACYGFDTVEATFFEETGSSFSGPSDLVEMLQLHTLRSTPFDEEEEEWGIGYFRISLDGTDDPLVIMATGDVIVENDVEAANGAGIGAMQAFNFTTGGPSACAEAPNAVFIQSPDNISVDLVVNSTPIRISSTVVLGTFDENTEDSEPQDDTMWIAVVEGEAIMEPDSENAVTVAEGTASTVLLTDNDGENPSGDNLLNFQLVPVLDPLTGEPVLGPNGEPFYRQIPIEEFSDPIPITEDGDGIFSWNSYGFIEYIPSTLLNYEVDVPTVNDEPAPIVNEPVPEVPVNNPVDSSPVDEAVTECGTRNWCNAGEPWGDGRCNEDPATSDWFWNAGWYNAQQACGAIDSVPAEFQVAGPAVPEAVVEPPQGFNGEILECEEYGSYGFVIQINNIPNGSDVVLIQTAIETFIVVLNPASPPGPETVEIEVPPDRVPFINIVAENSANSSSVSGPLTGPTTC